MDDDLLEPDAPPQPGLDDLDDAELEQALERDDEPGIEGEEHLGLTPPG